MGQFELFIRVHVLAEQWIDLETGALQGLLQISQVFICNLLLITNGILEGGVGGCSFSQNIGCEKIIDSTKRKQDVIKYNVK